MLRIKRMICCLLLLVLAVSMLPQTTFAFPVTTPGGTNLSCFTAAPGVYEMGDGYAVIWATSFKGTGYIQYQYNGKNYTVYDMKNGIVRTGDTVHVVKVPHEHLLGNSYTVYSQEVSGHSYALTNYSGVTASMGPIYLKAYDGGSDFDLLVLTDTHNQLNWTVDIASRFSSDPDLVVFSGDIADRLTSKKDIAHLFNIMGKTTGGQYPIVYCRGNHEIRDLYSTALLEYFPTETGEFYFDFRYGPLWGVVMDTGEDKADSHEYYGNLANFTEYHQKQEAWLRSLHRDTTATYRLGIYHISRIQDLLNGIDFSDSIEHLGLQFGISGHYHSCELYGASSLDYKAKVRHSTLVAGGYEANVAVWVNMNSATQKAYLTTQLGSGTQTKYDIYDRYEVALSDYIGTTPAKQEAPVSGLCNQFHPTAASQGTVSLATQPAVFESGGDWYNVVWKTTKPSSAEGVTGYVEYTYNGKTYQQFDEAGGYRRTFDDFHTVKVPKAHLNNNTYKIGSFLMEYAATASGSRYYTAGDWVESKTYLFENKTQDAAVSFVACPDLELNGESARLTNACNAVTALGTSPAYVVLNGCVVNPALYGGDQLTHLLEGAAAVSGSIHPIILSRGFSECRGFTASNLLKYIPTVTGEFYYTVDAGEYTFVNLDTAEDQADNATAVVGGSTVSKYGNRVFFDSYREDQLNWIQNLPTGKLIAISSTPLSEVYNVFGLDYETALKKKGAVIAVSGHNSTFSLDNSVNSRSIYTVNPGGRSNSAGTDVVSVLLSGDYAYITDSRSNNGTTNYQARTSVSLSTGNPAGYNAAQPPISNGVYLVSTPGHLKWISNNCSSTKSFAGQTFHLVNDIDMQLVPFTPIGGNDTISSDNNTESLGFCGTFDGNGYTIKNVNIVSDGKNNVGFFGLVRHGCLIKNLTLSGGMVTGSMYVGSLVGSAYVMNVQDCASDLIVYSPAGSASGSKVGGLMGFISGGTTILRCANYGSVSAHHEYGNAGGLVGMVYGTTDNVIESSFNRGNIAQHGTAAGAAGGIAGYLTATTAIKNCYNAAAVTSAMYEGAITGHYETNHKIIFSNTYFATGYNGAATGLASSNNWNTASGSGTVTPYGQDAMKSHVFAQILQADTFAYHPTLNDGYPVHRQNLTHSYESRVTAPTCTQDGYTTYTCHTCGYSYTTDVVAAPGHSYESSVTVPGCTQYGCTVYTCRVCGYTYEDNLIASLGHNYSYSVTREPSVDAAGTLTGICSRCPVMTEVSLPRLSAADYTYSQVTPSSCNTYGTGVYTWKTTDYGTFRFNVVLSKTEHSYTTAVIAPSCTREGYTKHTCRICGDSYTDSTTAAIGHTFVSGQCTVCFETDPDYADPNAEYYLFGYINGANYACEEDYENIGQYHFVNGQLTATFDQDSYVGVKTGDNSAWYMTDGWQGNTATSVTLYNTKKLVNADKLLIPANVTVIFTMSVNADNTLTLSYEIAEPELTQPTITLKYPTLSFEDVIVMNVYFTAEQLQDVEDIGLITYKSQVSEWNIGNADFVIPGYSYDQSKGLYSTTTQGIPAKQLGDTMWFAVYAKLTDGSYVYTRLVSYSPETYAYSQLATGDASVKPLVVAMLKYGAAAQTFFNYRVDSLVDRNLTFEQLAMVESYRPDMMSQVVNPDTDKAANFVRNGGFTNRYPSISFEGAFSINYYCTPSAVPSGDVTMYFWNQKDFDKADVLTTDNATLAIKMADENGRFTATVEQIAAKDLDKGVYVAFVYSDGTTTWNSGILAYSIGAYCVTHASAGTEFSPFAEATAVYGYYAKKLFD